MRHGGFEAVFASHHSACSRYINNVKGSPVVLLLEGKMGFNFANLFSVVASHVEDTTEFVMKLIINQNLKRAYKIQITLHKFK
jgi:hypothetical protein